VESVVCSHESVTHCAAVGVADPRKMEAVRIYVVARKDLAICREDLLLWLKPRMAHFKLPRDILFVEELPRLGNGKLDRVKLRDWAMQELA
jgi:fatty-acyl-CoA synthase